MKKVIVLKMVLVAAVLLTASMVSASTTWIRLAEDGPGNWDDPANWDNGVPTLTTDFTYTGATNGLAEIQITSDVTYGTQLYHGNFSPSGITTPTLRIMDGGSLSKGTNAGTASHCYISPGDGQIGHMVIEDGGTFNGWAKLYIGKNTGCNATVDLAGVLDLTTGTHGMVVLGDNGIGTLNILDGGVLKTPTFRDTYNGIDQPIKAGGSITLQGSGMIEGKVTTSAYYFNNEKIWAQALVDSGKVNGVVVQTGDASYGQTFIVAVPEPATMVLLGLGGLLLRKRR